MLTDDDLLHFAAHGWVILRAVFDADACARYRAALDGLARHRRLDRGSDAELAVVQNQVFHDQCFLDWFRGRGILAANRRLLGAKLRYQGANAHIKRPHADRATRAAALRDPGAWNWHRGIRPKWGVFPDDRDPRFINCAFLNNVTYLTPVAPGDGSTAILDGSHRSEGDYASLRGRFPVVEPEAAAGDVLVFSESLLHSAAPILSERVRYNMYYGFVPPWWSCWPGMDVPTELRETIADDELRELVGPPHFGGQEAEA